jgi:hypothetical protein
MSNNLTLRTLTSPYGDNTKGSVLSQGELDSNFIYLKGEVIYSAETINGAVNLKKYNGNDISFYTNGVSIDSGDLLTLISNSGLTQGTTYKISGVHPSLYGGTDIFLLATSSTTVAKNGHGLFYNPKYADYAIWNDVDKLGYSVKNGYFIVGETLVGDGGQTGILATLPGDLSISIHQRTGDWSTATSLTGSTSNSEMTITSVITATTYSIGDKVIWGGKVWENVNGNVGESVDMYTLDAEWSVIDYNETDYTLVTDEIAYDYVNDYIYFRKDSFNEVTFNYELNYAESSITAFPWGGNVFLCKINNAIIYDENSVKRNLLNCLAQAVTALEADLLSVVSFDYIGYEVGISDIKIGVTCTVKDITIGDDVSLEQIFMGSSTSMIDINIANNDDGYTQGLRNIRLNKGYTDDNIIFYPNNNSYIQHVNILSEAIIDNLEIGFSTQGAGSYFNELTMYEGSFLLNLKVGDSAYIDTLEIQPNGIISELVLGPSTYMENIVVGGDSAFISSKLNGSTLLNLTATSYIIDLTITNSATLSGLELGFSSYIQNVNLDGGVMSYITLNPKSYIDGLTGVTSDIVNVTLEGGFDGMSTPCYLTNISMDDSQMLDLNLGKSAKIDTLSLTNTDFVVLDLGQLTLLNNITCNGGVSGATFGQITTGQLCEFSNITIGEASNFAQMNLGGNVQIANITIGDGCNFDTMTLKEGSLLTNIVLDNSSGLVYIEMGVAAEMSNIYMPTSTILSDVRIGGPLILSSFTGSSLTSNNGYVIDHDNNNFPAVLDITGFSTIDLSNIYYAGEVTLTSSNPSESISAIDGAQRFYPVKFMIETGLTVNFIATPVSGLSSTTQFINSVSAVTLNGNKLDYIVIKNIKDDYLQVIESKNNL